MNENLSERVMSLRDEALQRIDPKQEQWKQRFLIDEQGRRRIGCLTGRRL